MATEKRPMPKEPYWLLWAREIQALAARYAPGPNMRIAEHQRLPRLGG